MPSKRRARKVLDLDEEDDDMAAASVVILSSTDDEEANQDLSLEIVERSRHRDAKRSRKAAKTPEIVDVPSSDEFEVVVPVEKAAKKKKKRRSKKEERLVEAENDRNVVDLAVKEEQPVVAASGGADSIVTEVNEASDNVVLKKLLRGPRYFDAEGSNWKFCYNCNTEGHTAFTCTVEKRKKPCFVCGVFGHNGRHCSQGQYCFLCKRRGHVANDCPEKQKKSQNSKICLRCGDLGHDMSVCTNDYAPEDLKEMQCYVCKKFGHLCCVESIDTGPRVVSCYNCGLPGHSGIGCAKPRFQTSAADSPALCYECGQEGHFARGCTTKAKRHRFTRQISTPSTKSNRGKESTKLRSAPNGFDKLHKKKSVEFERKTMSAAKSRIKGGWIVDDPGDFPRDKFKSNSQLTPLAPSRSAKTARKSSKSPKSWQNASPWSVHKKHKPYPRTPHSASSANHYYPADRSSRFSESGTEFLFNRLM